MKCIKNLISCLLLIFVSYTFLSGQDLGPGPGMKKKGQATMTFLQVGLSPRASSMGGAFAAVGKGAESIFYNPAAVTQFEGNFQAYATNTQFIADINHIAGAIAFKINPIGTMGLSFQTVDYGEIIHTSLLTHSEFQTNPKGYIEHGTIDNIGAYALGLTYAREITNKFSIGGNIRYVGQNLGSVQPNDTTDLDFNEANLVYDMGVLFKTGFKSFKFGMSIRNFATSVQFQEISNQLPLTFNLGGSVNMMDFIDEDNDNHSIILSAEFSHPNNYSERAKVGMEYTFIDLFSIRAGYLGNSDISGFSAGFGVRPEISGKRINIDYSYSPTIDYFDSVTRLSIGFSL